jgi:uncharacterized protein YprB with RNaseH-like and TPR domain
MLTSTFLHIPGVGKKTETNLWRAGCRDWKSLLEGLESYRLGTASRETARTVIEKSTESLANSHHQYFAKALGLTEAWRAFPEFRDSCVYLDIETNGGYDGEAVTMVGLYDGVEFRALIKDEDLGEFPDIISRYGMIVTFFGGGFDLPMLQRKFWGLRFDQIHLDLCPLLRRVGYRGGLKSVERQLGIERSSETAGLSGWDAVRLWNLYRRGDDSARELLTAYNREDVVNLEKLAEFGYSQMRHYTLPDGFA